MDIRKVRKNWPAPLVHRDELKLPYSIGGDPLTRVDGRFHRIDPGRLSPADRN
jgi:hypothetical protein